MFVSPKNIYESKRLEDVLKEKLLWAYSKEEVFRLLEIVDKVKGKFFEKEADSNKDKKRLKRVFYHSLSVLLIDLIEFWQKDIDILIAELLHDTVEKGVCSLEEINEKYWEKIWNNVWKLTHKDWEDKDERFSDIANDEEASKMKICDFISNIRSFFIEIDLGLEGDNDNLAYKNSERIRKLGKKISNAEKFIWFYVQSDFYNEIYSEKLKDEIQLCRERFSDIICLSCIN